MKPGHDYIGIGVGAMVFNEDGEVFLSQRGPHSGNEKGTWEFPGGKVFFGETLADAIIREFIEEYGMEIKIVELLGVNDHILLEEHQHWVSPTFIARHHSGIPAILEPTKCTAIGWFTLDTLPQPLSQVTLNDMEMYRLKHGQRSDWFD